MLQVTAKVFKACLRDGDLPARLGGEEFAALLPYASPEQALAAGERIRLAIANMPIRLPDDRVLSITASIGVAHWNTEDEDIQPALKRADVALYQAKEGGRNRVVVHEESTKHEE